MNKKTTQSRFVDVLGSKLHYFEKGGGATPVLFVHGIPTSAYVWRHVIDKLNETESYRYLALDLIGLGESDKPDITYSVKDYLEYFSAFIDALNLNNIILVLHGWGSIPGLAYAMGNEDKVKGIIFYEAYVRPVLDWSMMSLPMQELAALTINKKSLEQIANSDYFIDRLLPRAILDEMPIEEANRYKTALSKNSHYQPLLQYLKELPTGEEPELVHKMIRHYSRQLEKTKIPKLLIYGVPGYNTTIATVSWAKEHLPNLTIVDIGPSLHFAQETNPIAFASTINHWFYKIQPKDKAVD